jgi:2-amino-4-hydroxy-6-hydroxymethyldihydropteridine diphosphokinase
MPRLTRVAIALGSNVGNRVAHLQFALGRLRAVLSDLRSSSLHDTTPVGAPPVPRFLNAAVTGLTDRPVRPCLTELLAIERERGRLRPHHNAPRTLDLDLVLFGDAVVEEPGLVVPHPRFRERRFVLEPLAEIAGDWVDPVTGLTIDELLLRLDRPPR